MLKLYTKVSTPCVYGTNIADNERYNFSITHTKAENERAEKSMVLIFNTFFANLKKCYIDKTGRVREFFFELL